MKPSVHTCKHGACHGLGPTRPIPPATAKIAIAWKDYALVDGRDGSLGIGDGFARPQQHESRVP